MMTAETVPNTTKTFKFSFPTCTNEEVLFNLEVPVSIPLDGSPRELVQRVINMFHIPVYLEDELNEKLEQFVVAETRSFHNERDAALLDRLKGNDLDVDGIVRNWEKMFKELVVPYADRRGTPDSEVLAAAHQRLAASPALHDMLRREMEDARAVGQLIRERDHDIGTMVQRQTEEMDALVRSLGSSSSEADINALAALQWGASSGARARWASARDALCAQQRAEHRNWVMATVQEQFIDNGASSTAAPPPLPPLPPPPPRLEESFTIHLGSQLKHTHNIRIVAMDMLDLARINPDNPSEWSRRMQTALSLYSSGLSAMVLLTDCQPLAVTHTLTEGLLAAASASTDHHFPDVETQLREIKERIAEPVEARDSARAPPRPRRPALRPGDVYVTRHSNLADVHVVFHLMVDDTLKGDISSRHGAVLGLRSVLRACAANDVTTLHLPLLLAHELTEEMTMGWCLRRAELVLKCVKGFALEVAGGGGAELQTVSVTVPTEIDPAVFAALAQLTPTIFRLSNPVRAKASPT